MINKMTKLMTALGLMAAASATIAQSSTATMGISAAIANECSVGNVVPLAFGSLAMLTAGAQSSSASESTGGGTFDAICTYGAPAPKFKFVSANTGGSDFRLRGDNGMTFITYNVAESGGTAIAHDTAAAFTDFYAIGTAIPLRIKGSIPAANKAGKTVQPYSDTITITASFTP